MYASCHDLCGKQIDRKRKQHLRGGQSTALFRLIVSILILNKDSKLSLFISIGFQKSIHSAPTVS